MVHIDHGVGRFGGLVKIDEGGKSHEAIKLVYKDGDVLFVNVHSLHRISRYKSGDGEPPKIYKLGGGAWQKLKNATKKAVKECQKASKLPVTGVCDWATWCALLCVM